MIRKADSMTVNRDLTPEANELMLEAVSQKLEALEVIRRDLCETYERWKKKNIPGADELKAKIETIEVELEATRQARDPLSRSVPFDGQDPYLVAFSVPNPLKRVG